MGFSFPRSCKDGGGTQPPRGPAEVRAYWEALRRDGAIPARADLDPRGLADVLEQVFVAERIGKGLVRLRIAGMALTELAGAEMRGLPLSALFASGARAQLAEVLDRVLTLPQVAELQLAAESGIGRPALSARLLLLPLRSNAGARDLVLGCLATRGEVGRGPRHFSITRATEERLTLPCLSQIAAPPHLSAFAEPPVPPLAPARPGRAHLRLVHSAG